VQVTYKKLSFTAKVKLLTAEILELYIIIIIIIIIIVQFLLFMYWHSNYKASNWYSTGRQGKYSETG